MKGNNKENKKTDNRPILKCEVCGTTESKLWEHTRLCLDCKIKQDKPKKIHKHKQCLRNDGRSGYWKNIPKECPFCGHDEIKSERGRFVYAYWKKGKFIKRDKEQTDGNRRLICMNCYEFLTDYQPCNRCGELITGVHDEYDCKRK